MTVAIPLHPLFDTLAHMTEATPPNWARFPSFCPADFNYARAFLMSYNGRQMTFNAYRREVERVLHWSWQLMHKSVRTLQRADIEHYLSFCQQPPDGWISLKRVPRFILKNGQRVPNKTWRPFVVTLKKSDLRHGKTPHVSDYCLSESALKDIFSILSSFYNFLIQEEACQHNPIIQIRQKSKFSRDIVSCYRNII